MEKPSKWISTHALTWSATRSPPCKNPLMKPISTHALTWSATFKFPTNGITNKISTHALTWSATGYEIPQLILDYNFNSRAHVERDSRTCAVARSNGISTHALTWSATIFSAVNKVAGHISTHALTWSATFARYVHCITARDFNSRAHVERDRRGSQRLHSMRHFNSRAHVERDAARAGYV